MSEYKKVANITFHVKVDENSYQLHAEVLTYPGSP